MSQSVLSSMIIESTGGDQTWVTLTDTISLAQGSQTLRIYAASGGWSMNWINFVKFIPTSMNQELSLSSGYSLSVNPNPIKEVFTLSYSVPDHSPIEFSLYDSNGRLIEKRVRMDVSSRQGTIEWAPGIQASAGLYFLTMQQAGRKMISHKNFKIAIVNRDGNVPGHRLDPQDWPIWWLLMKC